MHKSDVLNLEARRKIYNYVLENPGLHLHEIARRLKLTFNNLEYHINFLRKIGFITIKKEKFYTRVYAKDKVSILDKKYLNILQQRTPRRILLALILKGAYTQQEISEFLDKHPTTISYHLKRLLDIGIIKKAKYKDGIVFLNRSDKRMLERKCSKNEIFYTLDNYDYTKNIFLTYKKSLYKDKIFKFGMEYIEMVSSAFNKSNKTKNIKTSKFYNDKFYNVIYEILPCPFCA